MSQATNRLAVCSWSLQPATPELLAGYLTEIGIPRVQLALDPLRENPQVWGRTSEILAAAGIEIVSGMFGTVGEDYTTLETIKQTGGVVPDVTWPQNWENIKRTLALARELKIGVITFHAGFLPHDESDPSFKKLLGRIRQIGELFADANIQLGFETGQETAPTLGAFLSELNLPSVGVNFDPANMLLYDKGDPIQALAHLFPWLKQCHIKDANRTHTPGTWGEEVVVGTGQVDWSAFFTTLKSKGYSGNLAIEREAGNQRIADIIAAKRFVQPLI